MGTAVVDSVSRFQGDGLRRGLVEPPESAAMRLVAGIDHSDLLDCVGSD